MLVEDDGVIRLVKIALQDGGYEVLEAENGETALIMALDEAADVLLVDLRLSGIFGLDVVRTVRAASRVPIIVLTAQTEDRACSSPTWWPARRPDAQPLHPEACRGEC